MSGDTTCRDRATYVVAELAKRQASNATAGFATGYLSGFPESDITAVEAGTMVTFNLVGTRGRMCVDQGWRSAHQFRGG